MLSFGQLTVPIGVFTGYLIASICISINSNDGWKYTFVIQSIAIFLMIIPFFYAPESVFESKNAESSHKYTKRRNERNPEKRSKILFGSYKGYLYVLFISDIGN